MITQLRNLLSIASGRNARSTMFYLGGNVLAAVFPLLLLPVLTRHLTAAEYGVYALALVLAQSIFPLASLGLVNAVTRDFVDQRKLDFPRVVSISLFVSTASLLIVVVLIEAARMLGIASSLGADEELPDFFLLAVYVMVASQNVMAFVLSILQMNERPIAYGLLRLGSQLFFAGLALLFVVAWQSGTPGVVGGKALADAATLVIGLIILANGRLLVPRWNTSEAWRLLKYGLPLVPHMFSVSLIAVVDRLLLAEIVGVSATGVYMAGFQIGMVMWLIVNSTNQAWVPWFYKAMAAGADSAVPRIRRAILTVGGAYVAIAICLSALAPYALLLLSGPEFHGAAPVAALVVIAFLFQGFYGLFNSFLYYAKRTGILSVASAIAVVVNAVSCYVLIHSFGITGAALGTILGYFASFVFVAWFAKPYFVRSQSTVDDEAT
ncbi:oligosaccharide flippase family protein [Oceaniradius stylonematis]|uniref:oligosaccharide flippase family protein n=1 Tax=Oceaniradius stylonematis TaxID=2184161 RepID=UPI003C7BEA1D